MIDDGDKMGMTPDKYRIKNGAPAKQIMPVLRFVILLMFTLGMVALAILQSPMADDYWYYNALHDSTFQAFFTREYFTWTGRIFNSFFMFFATLNPFFYFVLSGVIIGSTLVLLAYAMTSCALARKARILHNGFDFLTFVLIFACLWFLIPDLGECSFWRAGYASYLAPAAMGFGFLFFYVDAAHRESKPQYPAAACVALGILGFFAGSSQEQAAVSFGFIAFVMLLWMFFNKRIFRGNLHLLVGFFSFAVGALALLLAPGNSVRQKSMGADPQKSISAVARQLENIFLPNLRQPHTLLLLVFAAFFLVDLVCCIQHRQRVSFPWKGILLWLAAAAVSVAPFFYTGALAIIQSGVRISYLSLLFLIVAFAAFVRNVQEVRILRSIRIAYRIAGPTAALVLLIPVFMGVKSSYRLLQQVDVRDQVVLSEKAAGVEEIAVLPLTVEDSRVTFFGGDGVEAWMAQVAKYYKVKSIRTDASAADKFQNLKPRLSARSWFGLTH